MNPMAQLALDKLVHSFIVLKMHVEQDGNPLDTLMLQKECHHWQWQVSFYLAVGVNTDRNVYH